MTGKTDNKAEKLMSAYYDYIGEQYLENLCRDMEARAEEINRVKVPDSLDQWFGQYIMQYKKKEAARRFFKKFRAVGIRTAAFLFVLVASLFIITVSVDAIRLKVYNLLLESNNKYSSVRVDENPTVSIDWEDYYFPAWLPEGFHMEKATELRNIKIIKFTNDSDQYISFTQAINGTDIQMDTESGSQREVIVNHQMAILSEKSGESVLFWNNDESSFCLSSGLSSEILIQIAQSVKKK